MIKTAVAYAGAQPSEQITQLALRLNLPMVNEENESAFDYLLKFDGDHLLLWFSRDKNINPISVDFVTGSAKHRRLYGGGELIVRACGIKKSATPLTVCDLTAGLGRDGFILACTGCKVTLIERSPIIAALLENGLQILKKEPELGSSIHMELVQSDALSYLNRLTNYPDIIYFDPMHPSRTKSALVKKEMRFLREIVGDDGDVDLVFLEALKKAKKRVVVKRPRHAENLADKKPSVCFLGKSVRFDVYVLGPPAKPG